MWLAAAMTRLTIAGAFSGAIARVPTRAALPAWGTSSSPVSVSTAPLSPAEIAAWQDELDNWDAFLVFAIKQIGLTLPNQQMRDQLFTLLMDSRYRLVQAIKVKGAPVIEIYKRN